MAGQTPVAPGGITPTETVLTRLQRAAERGDYKLVQVRRVRGFFQSLGRGGEWVGAVETLLHRGGRAGVSEAFAVDLLGLENTVLSPVQLAHRRRVYQGQADFLVRHQSFRVFDAHLAAQLYRVTFVGQAVRAQRPCLRIAVVATTQDRPSWLIDVDVATDYPMYCGEFSSRGELVAELEVLRADFGTAAQIPAGSDWVWTPRASIVETATVSDAVARLRQAQVIEPSPTSVGASYLFDRARVLTDPLTGESTLTLIYTDGIDSTFVTQQTKPPIADNGNVARVFNDAGITQVSFQHKSTEFLVIGRHAQVREIARRIFAQAVATL